MPQIFRETKSQVTLKYRPTLDFPPHVHDDIELVYVKHGCGNAYCDGKKYSLQPNALFLVFPNQVHHYADFSAGEYLLLIMKPSALLRYDQFFMKGIPQSPLHTFGYESDNGIFQLLEIAHRETDRDGYSDIIAAYLTAVIGKLIPLYPMEKVAFPRENVLKILQYCTSHYKEDLTVDTVAQQLAISRSCVSHIFSTRLSMNFCDYINSLRLAEAEQLLQNRNYSLTEAANLAGFPTIRTFNRAFRKKHGTSPSAYRKMLQNSVP